jgi:hypothetical protein
MSAPNLPTWLWVDALRRRAEAAGAYVMVVRRGDAERGLVWVKALDGAGGVSLLCPAHSQSGAAAFALQQADDEAVADATIGRELARDPDLWVVEITDRKGRHFLTEMVLES